MQRVTHLRHVVVRNTRADAPTITIRRKSSKAPSKFHRPPSSQKKDAVQASGIPKPVRSHKTFFVASAIFGGILGIYAVQLFIAANKPNTNPAIASLAAQRDVSARYDDTADGFDSEVGLSEMVMLINRIRKKLAQKCHGHVLEVSCGTGRNLGYYDIGPEGKVKSLTFVDLSPQMIEICKRKWDALLGGKGNEKLKKGLVVRFLPGSALEAMPPAPTPSSNGKYDTIIQTMGLCSTPTPVELLTNTVKYLDTTKDSSRILLLEHGRSYKDWLNRILDNSAEKHAEIHGCWFNRDIGQLVEAAAEKAGLEIVGERRHHFGTTWVFELKPKAGPGNQGDGDVGEEEKGKGKSEGTGGGGSWLRWK